MQRPVTVKELHVRSNAFGDAKVFTQSHKRCHRATNTVAIMARAVAPPAAARTQKRVVDTRKPAGGDNGSGSSGSRGYLLLAGFPLRPFTERETRRYEVVKDRVWTFEQPQGLGFSNVTINVRMTVVRLRDGRLWVHAPIAPTSQCMRLLNDIGGEVAYIVLPTFAVEHKVFVGPFSRKFPKAEVWVAPGQWSWPINLPLATVGVFKSKVMSEDNIPWKDDIELKLFFPPQVGIGPYVECAFFHKSSRTLLVTDAVVKIPSRAPDVVNPSLLLDAARPNPFGFWQPVPEDSAEARQLGWRRMVLQVLFFGPANLTDPTETFEKIANRLVVSPVVRTLVFTKVPAATQEWVERICQWNFNKIIPCHLSAPIPATPNDLREAFAFVYGKTPGLLGTGLFAKEPFNFPSDDMKILDGLNSLVTSSGILYEDPEK